MTNTEKLYNKIDECEKAIAELKIKRDALQKQVHELSEDICDLELTISDCESAICEINYIDNGSYDF